MAHHQEEPASSIIRHLGGVAVVANLVGKHPSRIYRWTYPTSVREGTGGLIPARHQITLLEHARQKGIDLRPDDFFSPNRLKQLETVAEAAE